MLQDFPAETGVVHAKKEPPKLEGFYSEKARALDKLLALDKALAAKQAAAAQKTFASKKPNPAIDALRRTRVAISQLRSQLAIDGLRKSQLGPRRIDGLRRSMTFAAPVVTVLAAIALAAVAIASWRGAPATDSIQLARKSTDVALPATQVAGNGLPVQPVASQINVEREASLPFVPPTKISSAPVSSSPVPMSVTPATAGAIIVPDEPQPARVSMIGNVTEPQSVATSLQAHLGAPVDEPPPVPLNQPTQVGTLATAPVVARRAIEAPAERMEVAPIAVQQMAADPTPAIRDVIRRYEAAYERLDASAAKEIWPSLDERALARAFSGLASQTLTLEPCNIDVTGSSAVASCHGFATYKGRVGNKMGQVQRRDWTFVLHKATDDWQIRSVRSN